MRVVTMWNTYWALAELLLWLLERHLDISYTLATRTLCCGKVTKAIVGCRDSDGETKYLYWTFGGHELLASLARAELVTIT